MFKCNSSTYVTGSCGEYYTFHTDAELIEIPVKEIIKYLYEIDPLVVSKELKTLLRIYRIPEKYVDRVEAILKERIKSELEKRNLPTEEWLINALYKIIVHIYADLCQVMDK